MERGGFKTHNDDIISQWHRFEQIPISQLRRSKHHVIIKSDEDSKADVAMMKSESEEVGSGPGGWMPDLTVKQEQEKEEKGNQSNRFKQQVIDESDEDCKAMWQ